MPRRAMTNQADAADMDFNSRAESSSNARPNSGLGVLSAAILALLAAAAFVLLASPRLTAQGPYQDELHQAAPAFCYLGSPPEQGINLEYRGIPVLNTSYSGALKTAIYGLYLRFIEPRFSLFSWRLLGILLTAGGLGLFVWMGRRALSPISLAVFLALFLTDGTVLLAVRHDWGPVALALTLRLAFAAVWLSGETIHGDVRKTNSFALGSVVGIAVFEKLSSIVLLWPLALIMTLSPGRRRLKHWWAAAAGLTVGLVPLFLANLHSWSQKGWFSSLETIARAKTPENWSTLGHYAHAYLHIGSGSAVRGFILDSQPRLTDFLELLLIPLLALALILILFRAKRGDPVLRWAGIALASYVGIAVAYKLFPRPTWIHHWILGTPWQYWAVALVAARLRWGGGVGNKILSFAAATVLAIWLPIRVAGLVYLERELLRGEASEAWSPELTTLGEFAAQQCGKARFIALTWGVSYQIYTFSNGCPGITRELFWDYEGPDHLRQILTSSARPEVYLVGRPGNSIRPQNEERIERDFRALPGWSEAPLPAEIAALKTIRFVRFVPSVE